MYNGHGDCVSFSGSLRLNVKHLCVCFISMGETERYKWVYLPWNLVAAYISLKTARYELDIRGRRGVGERWKEERQSDVDPDYERCTV